MRGKAGAQQAYAAIDIESYSARGDYAVGDARCSNPADRKSVAPVHIGHCHRISDDARQKGYVGHLLW